MNTTIYKNKVEQQLFTNKIYNDILNKEKCIFEVRMIEMKKFFNRVKKQALSIDKNYYIIILISFILLAPLLSYFYVNGHDTSFHLSNSNILYNYLKNDKFNTFNLKILDIVANNFGYGIGIFYPRICHSIIAYITLITGNIVNSIKVYQLIVIILSGIFMYKLINRVSNSKNGALMGSIFYICSPYFMSEFYVRSAFAESLIFIFTPMIFLGIYDYLFLNNKKNFYLFFVIGFIGIINSHLVTGVFLVMLLIIFLLFNIKRVLKKDIIISFLVASILILILSSPFLIPMLQHKLFGNYAVFIENYMGNPSWAYGTALNISDYFSITFNEKNNGISFYLNIIMFIMAIYSVINYKKITEKIGNNQFIASIIMLSLITLIFSTKLIPWNKFPSIFLLIQFPWRLELFSIFFLSILSSLIVVLWSDIKLNLYKPIIIIATIFIALTSIDYSRINYLNQYNMSRDPMGSQMEYLPSNTINNIEYFNTREQDTIVKSGNADVKILNNLVPFMDANVEVEDTATIELPRLFYFGYNITLKNEKGIQQIKYYENDNGFIEIELNESGYLKVDYVGTKLHRICNILSIITIVLIGIYMIFKFIKKRGDIIMDFIKKSEKKLMSKKNINIIKRNKLKIFFIVGFIFVFPFLAPHFALDSYTLVGGSYSSYALHFLKAGRVVSAALYYIFELINLPYNTLSVLSTIFSVVILGFTINEFINLIKENKFNSLNFILLYFISFILFYNFMNMELFIFMESFVMFLGIYFIVKSIKFFLNEPVKDKLISLLFLILGIFCYQGVLSIYIPLILFFILTNKELNIKDKIKNIFISVIYYGISFVSSFLIIKLVSLFTNVTEAKVNGINLIDNISLIPSLIKETFNNLFGLYSVKVFYLIIIVLIVSILIIKEKHKSTKLINLFLIILSCLIFAYVPNIFMSSSNNYVAPRMLGSIGIIIPIILLYIITNFKYEKSKISKYVIIIIVLFNFCYLGFNYFKNYRLSLKTYSRDQQYVMNIVEKIDKYEKENDIKIENIYYGRDMVVYYHYEDGISNGFNYRIQAIDWAFCGYLDSMKEGQYNFYKMSDFEIKEMFGTKNYDEFNIEQLIFEENNLYILLY